MKLWNWFGGRTAQTAVVRTPLTPVEARMVKGFRHRREWICPCGARLAIRTRDDRPDRDSNFIVGPKGHSKLPAEDLTWNGLAEERGWKVHPTVSCPACQRGMTVAQYKQARREGKL